MMKDVIIIGAGTAGLTAAIYALRAGKSVLVLEQGNYGAYGIISRRPAEGGSGRDIGWGSIGGNCTGTPYR